MAKVSGRSSTATRSLARGTAQWPLSPFSLPLPSHTTLKRTPYFPSSFLPGKRLKSLPLALPASHCADSCWSSWDRAGTISVPT